MSGKAMGWALEQSTELPVDKLVLIAIGNFADDNHQCFPARKTLAKLAMCSIDTVDRSIRRLIESGMLEKDARFADRGGLRSNCYSLPVGDYSPAAHNPSRGDSRKLRPGGQPQDAATLAARTAATLAASGAATKGTFTEPSIEQTPKPPQGASTDVQINWRTAFATKDDYSGTNSIVDQSSINPGSIVDQSSILVEKTNENQSLSIEPIANSQEPKREDPKPQFAQSDMPSHVKPIANWSAAFSQSVENHETVIRAKTGEILLLNGTRQTWLEKFGGDGERLDLALIEIAGDINEGSRKPLAADVQGRLARKAGDKLDRDQRYRAAVASNAAAKATSKPVKLSRW